MKFAPFAAAVAGLAAAGTADAINPASSFFSNGAETNDHRIPSSYESAVIARRVLALTKLATLSTVFPPKDDDDKSEGHEEAGSAEIRPPGLEGLPIGLMDYVADCEDEGNPTILEIKIATTFKNARAGSNITLSMNWVPPYAPSKRITFLSRLALFVPFLSSSRYNAAAAPAGSDDNGAEGTPDTVPYSAANLPRFSLIGYLEDVRPNAIDSLKLTSCFTSKHPDAKYWLPGNVIHESQWSRLVVEKVYFIGGFGDRAYIGWIPIDEWKAVTKEEWQSIKLPGERRGWSEWSVDEAEEL